MPKYTLTSFVEKIILIFCSIWLIVAMEEEVEQDYTTISWIKKTIHPVKRRGSHLQVIGRHQGTQQEIT